ncbi:MAG: GTP 3',8-cyclase MoaA [Desulfobulbaceae bacterium]|jgi:cyclic pyranopterin phosphate synthase|nr:GTP 3',8-cyclase MoaA [Desulfobulbaceae bacterium]
MPREDIDSPPQPLCDNHGRRIRYLRLAITDRCNLRCHYCMPEEGVTPVGRRDTLSYEEMTRLARLFPSMGIDKVRITGGEPFARRDCLYLLRALKAVGVADLRLTTNGVETWRHLEALRDLGLSGLNLSLDSLERGRFAAITRRDHLDAVLKTLFNALALGLALKINTVALADLRDEEMRRLAELARDNPITVRFIEPMSFSGLPISVCQQAGRQADATGSAPEANEPLAARLARLFPHADAARPSGVSMVFSPPGFVGKIGYIAGHSRSFCQRCDKIRITAVGMLKNCLYDNGVLDLRRLLRGGATDAEIAQAIRLAVSRRNIDGHRTEQDCARSQQPSMATIGG